MKAWLLFCLVCFVSACGPSQPTADEGPRVAEAAKSIRLAAEQGDAEAQHRLGLSYVEGDGVPQDSSEAVKWFRLAAEQGNKEAADALSLMSQIGELAILQAKLWNETGLLYERVHQDSAEAVKWYRRAAEQGDAEGQFHVGRMSELVSQDSAEAVKWLRPAAEQGNAHAQRNLGSMYHLGYGVPQDYVQAHMWYNLAASRATGDEARKYAEVRDGLANRYLTRAQLAEAQRLAREWKPKTWEELKARD